MPAMKFAAIARSLPFVAVCLVVTACKDGAATPEGENESLDARGEVLGGSISDAMLPLDTLTSQAPPLRTAEVAEDGAEGEGDATLAEQVDEAAESAPAAEPEPEAEAEDPAN